MASQLAVCFTVNALQLKTNPLNPCSSKQVRTAQVDAYRDFLVGREEEAERLKIAMRELERQQSQMALKLVTQHPLSAPKLTDLYRSTSMSTLE